eukprot:118834-Pyramimonas_sp.AAC.1
MGERICLGSLLFSPTSGRDGPRGFQNELQTAQEAPNRAPRRSESFKQHKRAPTRPKRATGTLGVPPEDPYMVGEGPPAPRRAQVPMTGEGGPGTA